MCYYPLAEELLSRGHEGQWCGSGSIYFSGWIRIHIIVLPDSNPYNWNRIYIIFSLEPDSYHFLAGTGFITFFGCIRNHIFFWLYSDSYHFLAGTGSILSFGWIRTHIIFWLDPDPYIFFFSRTEG